MRVPTPPTRSARTLTSRGRRARSRVLAPRPGATSGSRERSGEVLDEGFLKQRGERGASVGKVAGDEGLAQAKAVEGGVEIGRDGRVDAGKDKAAAAISNEGWSLQRDRTVSADSLRQPPTFVPQVEKRILRCVLIIELLDVLKVAAEARPQIRTPRNVVGCGPAIGDEVQHGEKQQRLVRTLMALRPGARHSDMESVQSLNGLLKGAFVGRHQDKVSSWELRARRWSRAARL